MTGKEIRTKYLDFMKKRGHAVIPSAALVPDNDPTTLFTGSGMQPMVPYLMGEKHPKGTRITDSQRCFRAEDIDEVGDSSHTTFFEMLGNWSLGDYFKQEQLPWFFEFLTKVLLLDPERLYVTIYAGDEALKIPRDNESAIIWRKIFSNVGIGAIEADVGTEEDAAKRGMSKGERIFAYRGDTNWWSRAGGPSQMPPGEPGGPDSEVFFDFGTDHNKSYGEHCHPNCDCGRFLEIGNSVFMEYVKNDDGSFSPLPAQNVDFGGGLERLLAAENNEPDIFKADLLRGVVNKLESLSGKNYESNSEAFRIIADHIRGAVFMIGDDILPSNTEQGYFVRRLIRRSVRYADMLEVPEGEFQNIADGVIETFEDTYPFLREKSTIIKQAIEKEEMQFRRTLEKGLRQFNKLSLQVHVDTKDVAGERVIDPSTATGKKAISAQNAFELFTTYGFPIELTEEIAAEKGLVVDTKGFQVLMGEHREKSRSGAEHKFKGGLADNSEKVVEYHTTTHLLLAALRKELGDHVHQAGSNITGERLRFDFTHTEKIERETLDKIEADVNAAIEAGGEVSIETMNKSEAEDDSTVEGSFWDRYPDEVNVYTIKGTGNTVFSKELCGGPHVSNLRDIHGTFKITKEESSSAGVRRIKAVLE